MSTRVKNERMHGLKLVDEAESVWNWDSPAGRVRATRRAQLLIEAAQICSSTVCLELGCGTGLFTRKIIEQTSARVVGIDVSPDLLNVARRAAAKTVFVGADAMNLPFQSALFDAVFGSSVLHHLDIESSLLELRRILKPRGSLAFAEPNMLNPQIALQKNLPWLKRLLGDSPDETAIFRWGFARRLGAMGFQNIKIIPYDFLHPITPVCFIKLVDSIGQRLEKIPVIREIAGSVLISARAPD